MTALPIIETLAGDISAYVPTNVISITDGQIYLESELFNAGVRPAVNVGLSVSRVGGSAQVKGIRKVSGKLRLYLSQYRELSVFAQFGSELDRETTAMLEKGARITEALKQNVRSHYDTAHEIIVLYIAMKELLKDIPTNSVSNFVKAFTEYLDIHCTDIVDEIEKTNDMDMDAGLTVEREVRTFADYYFKEDEH